MTFCTWEGPWKGRTWAQCWSFPLRDPRHAFAAERGAAPSPAQTSLLPLSPPVCPTHPTAPSRRVAGLLGASPGTPAQAHSLGKKNVCERREAAAVPQQLLHGNHCQGDRALHPLCQAPPSGNFLQARMVPNSPVPVLCVPSPRSSPFLENATSQGFSSYINIYKAFWNPSKGQLRGFSSRTNTGVRGQTQPQSWEAAPNRPGAGAGFSAALCQALADVAAVSSSRWTEGLVRCSLLLPIGVSSGCAGCGCCRARDTSRCLQGVTAVPSTRCCATSSSGI